MTRYWFIVSFVYHYIALFLTCTAYHIICIHYLDNRLHKQLKYYIRHNFEGVSVVQHFLPYPDHQTCVRGPSNMSFIFLSLIVVPCNCCWHVLIPYCISVWIFQLGYCWKTAITTGLPTNIPAEECVNPSKTSGVWTYLMRQASQFTNVDNVFKYITILSTTTGFKHYSSQPIEDGMSHCQLTMQQVCTTLQKWNNFNEYSQTSRTSQFTPT